jgi:sirohydrochlorin cobaltochelatase
MAKEVILLAMHGAPPLDFPGPELGELFCLRARMVLSNGPERALYERQRGELEAKLRAWPRTAANDPFYAGSLDLARQLSRATGLEVVLGFIEFASPSLEQAFEQAVQPETGRVIVVTPMMTPGGEHSERDIPEAIEQARQRYPDLQVVYAWPFDGRQAAQFLAAHIEQITEMERIDAT